MWKQARKPIHLDTPELGNLGTSAGIRDVLTKEKWDILAKFLPILAKLWFGGIFGPIPSNWSSLPAAGEDPRGGAADNGGGLAVALMAEAEEEGMGRKP